MGEGDEREVIMPAIFSEEERRGLRLRMLDIGWELLRDKGFRALRVEDVARRAGLAKGTFYHFFPSKDAFLQEMVAENRRELSSEVEGLLSDEGRPDEARVRACLHEVWNSDRLVFRCVGLEDYRRVCLTLPEGFQLGPVAGSGIIGGLLERVAPGRDAEAHEVAMALQRVAALALMTEGVSDRATLDRVVDILIDDAVDVLFGRRDASGGPVREGAGRS